MLDGLEQIDWAALRDAYGPATDFPRRLRAVLSSDKDERHAAFGELFSSIVHQGTVYEATVVAAPFIIQLLRSPPPHDAEYVALLLASIAEGRGYFEVHARGVRDPRSSGKRCWRRGERRLRQSWNVSFESFEASVMLSPMDSTCRFRI